MHETEAECSQHRDFQNHFPAVDMINKHYSLQPDIAMGWRPKTKIMGPVPLNCDARLLDEIVDELTSFGSKYKTRVIYLGHRFASSFKMHQEMQRSYSFKYEGSMGANYQHMAAYFRKFHSNFKSKNTRIFKGMNPTIKAGSELIFDSNFESGNLDTVVKIGENEYDLFMRIDTNTRGHMQWFNFKVKNCGKKKIKFNIVNFQKNKTLYLRGMKPYVYSEYLKQTKETAWFQGGDNVKYSRKKINYQFLNERYEPQFITMNCLEFNYTFEVDWEEVQFAYSPPFTYTEMMDMITKIKREVYDRLQIEEQNFIREENLCESLSGLEVPLLTITDPKVDDKKKKCIVVSGRIHPGQSCGSFMGKGLLQFLCNDSLEARQLRKSVVFKLIPMLNPDGVVVGNFRTSLCGRDLNRTFKMSNDFLIPQVKALKQLVIKLKNEYKNRLIFFLDLHGHSVKKNVFLYGPEYEIWETNYYKTRIFPKILANKTDIFRYYSCVFRVAEFKKSTARAVMLRSIPHCYTIEASTGFYYCPIEKKDIPFTPQKWIYMGRMLGQGFRDYVQLLNEQSLSRQQRKQKMISLKTMKNNRIQSRKNTDKISSNRFQTRLIISTQKSKNSEDNEEKKPDQEVASKRIQDIIDAIKEDQKKFKEEKHQEGHQSDSFSQGGSDSESSEDDIPEGEFNQFQDKIYQYMQEFRQKYYKEKKEERQYSYKEPKRKIKERDDVKKSRKESRGIEMIPSLRKKNETIEKTRQIIVWNKIKDEFKELKNKGNDNHLNSRLLFSRGGLGQTLKHRSRRVNFQSEILNKRQTISGAYEFRSYG